MKLCSRLAIGACCLTTALAAAAPLTLAWTNNLLTVSGPSLPGGKFEIWYPEAFCRKGSTGRDWSATVWPCKTMLNSYGTFLLFETRFKPNLILRHGITSHRDSLDFEYTFLNFSDEAVDLAWFQPACMRVAGFTGCNQSNYTARSFIFTERGLTTLDKTDRRPEDAARYHGGQVYVPKGINTNDINPRPICRDQPVNGLIGCFSADGKYLLATASDSTHELFEGVYVCLHSDPHVGGLAPLESKTIRSKIYFMTNNPAELLKRYEVDFPRNASKSPAGF